MDPDEAAERLTKVLTPSEQKRIFKEALKEWLDDQFSRVGKWTMAGMTSMAFYLLVHAYLKVHGWAGD